MRLGPFPRALALVALLSVGILSPLAPPARAQEPALLCFEGENGASAGSCSLGLREPVDFLQGDRIGVNVQNVEGQSPYVRITCLENCRDVDGHRYYARWQGRTLLFPRDFVDPGPQDDGRSATADRVPRYNSTWEAAVLYSRDLTVRRTFHVWTMDLFRSGNLTVVPGETHHVRSSGLDSGQPVSVLVKRRTGTGVYEEVVNRTFPAPIDGVLRYDWHVPKHETANVTACGSRKEDCYQLHVSGGGKGAEVIPFRVGLATLIVDPLNPLPSDARRERTQSVELAFRVNYPGAAHAEGPKLLPEDVQQTLANPQRGLRVFIEEVNATNPDEGATHRNETWMTYVPDRFAWIVNWTIPRDLPLEKGFQTDASRYRLRLAGGHDVHGNRIPGMVLANLTVAPARLAPLLEEGPAYLGRAEPGRFVFSIRYHNGSVFGAAENATGLTGCVVRDTAALRTSCPAENLTHARIEGDRWVLPAHFGRAYPWVGDEGRHRVFLLDGLRDPWGNRVDARPEDASRAYLSDPFLVVPGSPRVEFSTVVRGEETRELARGDEVSVQAVITYADGSAFNHTVLPGESRTLNVTLTRRGANGAVQSEAPLVLRETDARAGRWMGFLPLSREDASSPAGRWTFTFDLRDNLTIPNANLTTFDRNVSAARIQLSPTFQPPASTPTGSTIKFRFTLQFEDGRVVPGGTIGDRVEARVHKWDRARQAHVGEPLSGVIVPTRIPGTDEFSLEYRVAPGLFAGDYVFVLSGGDAFGNRLRDGSASRPWSTFTETRLRSALSEPAPAVTRGDSATVVFDGRPGDVGGPGSGVPAIRLERWDVGGGQWVVERQTVRISDPSTADHVGVFEVTTNTVIGVYRFRLEGRDDTLNEIHAVSANFTVEPALVQRAIVTTPPEQVVKGETIQFGFERRNGDRLTQIEILFNGRPVKLQQPVVTADGARFNVTFAIPYEAETGNYSARIGGRDLYGNLLEVVSPPVDVQPAALLGKIIGNPPRVVARGEPATILFGITNPDGGYYFSEEAPIVEVHDGSGVVARAAVARDGLTFTATWSPPERAPETEYAFVVSGTGAGGNAFPTLRSATFRVAPGVVERDPLGQIPRESVRMGTITLEVPFEPDDEFVAFRLDYYGPTFDLSVALFETREPTTTSALPHTIDVEAGRYVARFVTTHRTPVGAYRIVMEGRDGHGNDVLAKSDAFMLQSTGVTLSWDPAPPDTAFGSGKTWERGFVARYRNGDAMTEEHGRPSVALLLDGKPVTPRPEIAFRGGKWVVTWTGPDTPLPDGTYTFSVGGVDNANNPIATSTTNNIVVRSDAGDSVGHFLKEVPAPSPLLLLGAIALVAALLGGRRRIER